MKNKLIYAFLFSSALILLCTQMYASGVAVVTEWHTAEASIHCPSRTLGGKVVEIRAADATFTEFRQMSPLATNDDGSVTIANATLKHVFADGREDQTDELVDVRTKKPFLFVFGVTPSAAEDFTLERLASLGLKVEGDEFDGHVVAYIGANPDYSRLFAAATTKGLAATAAAIVAQLTA